MKELIKNTTDTRLRQSILKVLAYFDVFYHPLSAEEIFIFLDDKNVDDQELSEMLKALLQARFIFMHNNFYSLKNDPEIAERRIKGNNNAQSVLPIGKKISKFLFKFPFVRGIGISGSLSKNVAAENSDIDYFIITKANRLWIARTFMHLFKKLSYVTGSQHRFCMNYFIDEEAMEIAEKNIFTAIELITLLPICGNGTMDKFFNTNNWAYNFYPNYTTNRDKTSAHDPWLKKAVESLMDNSFGDRIDNYFMKVTSRRWKKKEDEQRLNMKGDRMGLQTSKHFSKPNPVFFQQKVLGRFYSMLEELSPKWNEDFEDNQ